MRESASSIFVEVCDRGPGVDAGERDAIFEKFARGRRAAGQVQGTGMGLAMARQIARAHGGDVTVRSRSGGGSIFTLSVPREGCP
jgi:two-component system sensor histidine kinase KdpD